MKRLILICLTLTAFQVFGQGPTINLDAVRVPQFAASSAGGSYRLPVVYRARISGLRPNSPYQYVSRGIGSGDFNSTALFPGAGNPIFLDSGTWKTTSAPAFSTGANHDTLYSDGSGSYEGWFGFIVTTNTRFNQGKYIYPSITLRGLASNDTLKGYCLDSIKMLKFATNKSDTTGTGIWGHSMANAKSFVALYDDYNGSTRPLAVSMIENDGMSIGTSAVNFYKNSVEGISGNWGAIIPNNLSTGVRRIENIDRYTGFPIYGNSDSNGIWGPSAKSTVDPTGGLTAIALDENDAALVQPEVQFWARTSSTNEGAGTTEVYVVRRYSNDKSQSIRMQVLGGTATNGTDYTVSSPKTITFKPGGVANDTTKITITDDNISESSESIVFRLDQPSNCVIGTEVAHTVNMTDNDIANISFAKKIVVAKEDAGSISLRIRMDKAVGTASKVKIFVKSKGDSSFIPGEFRIGSGVDSTFNIGKTTGPDSLLIPCSIVNDANGDPNDTFNLVIRQTTGQGQVTDSTLTVVILDNDGPAQVRFIDKQLTVNENGGSFNVRIEIPFKTDAGGDFTLRLLSGGTATQGQDFTFSPTSQIKTIDENTPDTLVVNVPILDDDNFEATENIIFGLGVLSNVKVLSDDTLNITIINNDFPIYPIGTVNAQSLPNRANDSANVKCRVRGVVHSTNVRVTGLQFTLIDATGGITVFSPAKTFGYTPTEGDSIICQGSIRQFSGLGELQFLDTIIKLGTGRPLMTPTVVKNMTEDNESKLAKVNRVKLVDPSQWPTTALGPNTFKYLGIQHTDGNLDSIYIDSETDIDGTPVPPVYMNVTGVGQQFDGSSPFTSGYYLAPRRLSDIVAASLPVVQFSKATDTITELADSFRIDFSVAPLDENYTYDVVIKSATAVSPADYDYSTRTISVLKNNSVLPIKMNISDDNASDGDKNIVFAIRNIVGPANAGKDSILTLIIRDNEASRVKGFAANGLKLYPNPAQGVLHISSATTMGSVEILSVDGRTVLSNKNIGTSVELSLTGIAPGVYTARVSDNNGSVYSETFVIK